MSPPTRRLAELSDRALALRAQDGDPDAFDVLIDRHQGRLFRIAYLVSVSYTHLTLPTIYSV